MDPKLPDELASSSTTSVSVPSQKGPETPLAEPAQDTAALDSITDTNESIAAASSRFPIVGIGASAGGLEALEGLVRRLSNDAMAYVVLQHLSPGHESILTEILARNTAMKVVTIRHGLLLEQNTIYIAPPAV